MECEYNLLRDAFLGVGDIYNNKLKYLANMAQPEVWTFPGQKDYGILENYLCFTYDRLLQENKIVYDTDVAMCFDTGLLTKNNQDIYAYFEKNLNHNKKTGQDWYLIGFYPPTASKLKGFSCLPMYADYFTDPSDFIFDRNKKLVVDIDHVIDDNESRFNDIGIADKHMMKVMLTYAVDLISDKVKRNYKLAIPQFYTDKATKESKIQLLLPLYLKDELTANLALAVDKQTSQYVGKTILSLDWAYMNSRRICKPEVDWLKIES
jgi:hypothetical protein